MINNFNFQKLLKTNSNALKFFIYSTILIIIFYPHLEVAKLPLNGDEWYYSHPGVFNSFSSWIKLSYGHPPLWNYFQGILHVISDSNSYFIHLVSLALSFLSLIIINKVINFENPIYIPLGLLIFGIHFLKVYNSLAYPLLPTFAIALISLFYLNKSDYIKYSLFMLLALLLRESSLVFIFASILIFKNKRVLIYSLYSLIGFSLFIIWKEIYSLENSIKSIAKDAIHTSTGVLNFSPSYILSFYFDFIPANINPLIIALVIVCLCLSFYKRFQTSNLSKVLLIASIAHLLFFSTYFSRDPRNLVISSLGFIVYSLLIIKENFPKNLYIKSALLFLSLFFGFQYVNYDHSNYINYHRSRFEALKLMGNYLKENYHSLGIFDSSNIYANYPLPRSFKFTHLGIVKTPIFMSYIGNTEQINSFNSTPPKLILLDRTTHPQHQMAIDDFLKKYNYSKEKTFKKAEYSIELHSLAK